MRDVAGDEGEGADGRFPVELKPRGQRIVFALIAIGLLVTIPIFVERKSLTTILSTLQSNENFRSSDRHVTQNSSNDKLDFSSASEAPLDKSREDDVNATSESSGDLFRNRIEEYFDRLKLDPPDVRWVRDYFHWHYEMRKTFPEKELLDDPNGPHVAILYLDHTQKGGLTDRMKGIGHALRLAKVQNRVLLLKWFTEPLPLEAYLAPHLLNFTVPIHPVTETPQRLQKTYKETRDGSDRIILWKVSWHFGNYLHPYGVIWHAIFQPSAAVKEAIESTMLTKELVPGKYDAVHCRVGHPAFKGEKKYRNERDRQKDLDGAFNFEGVNRVVTMRAAIRGIRCVEWAAMSQQDTIKGKYTNDNATVYFYADSTDLVKAVVAPDSLKARGEGQLSLVETLKGLRSSKKIVGRHDSPVTHLVNRNNGTSPEAFISTFVDLYIASEARCIAMGVGRFAYMAAKIGGTICWTRHQIPSSSVGLQWGMKHMSDEVPPCPFAMSRR